MPRQAVVYTVVIASPSDTENERKALPEVIHAWNATHSPATGVVLQPAMWETHSTPEMGARPQAIINRQFIRGADILVAVFWTRLGTPTGAAESGTVEEIDEFREAGKPVMLYFSDAPAIPSRVNREQYERLEEYRERCQLEGLVEKYDSLGELREKFARHLTHVVRRLQEQRGEVFPEASDVRAQAAARLALKSEFEKFVRRLAAEWAAERDSQPPSLDGGKYIMGRASAAAVEFQAELPDGIPSSVAETLATACTRMRAIQQHAVYLDGGVSYDAFWRDGDEIIEQMRQVAPQLGESVPAPTTTAKTAEPQVKWVDMNYPADAGIVAAQEKDGYRTRWCKESDLARRVELEGYEIVLTDGPNGARLMLKMKDRPEDQVLVRKKGAPQAG